MLDWRIEAHKGKTQSQLNTAFDTVVETYQEKQLVSGKKGGRSQKSRRAKKASSNASGSSGSMNDTGKDDGSDGPDEEVMVTRKRIRLQRSRRVITERDT